MGSSSCPFGKGTADTTCRKTTATFLDQVDAAIDLLAQQKPEIFNLQDQRGTGGYYVKDVDAYYEGVVKNLQATGVCAGFDYQYLNIKNTNDSPISTTSSPPAATRVAGAPPTRAPAYPRTSPLTRRT